MDLETGKRLSKCFQFAHVVVTRIFTLLSTFQAISYKVTLLWVPGHKGVQGNNNVDMATKLASKKPRIHSPALLAKSDITSFARSPH